jgi:membrane protease YdiL (CAAX protease family)
MTEPSPPPRLLRLALAFYGALLGAALLWARLADRPLLFASAEAAARGVDPLRDAGAGALVGIVVVLLSGWFTRATRAGDRLARALANLVGRRSLGECVALALASGVGEEAFFRGAMQPQLGLVATSACFALAHFAPRRDLLPWTAFSLAAGLALGGLFEATGNLVAPVVAHAVVNAVNLRLLSRDYAAAPAGAGAPAERGPHPGEAGRSR